MKEISKLLSNCDLMSMEVNLFIKGNSNRVKNSVGGFISIFSFLCILGIVFYFFIQFIEKKNPIVISNLGFNKNNTIENIDQIPFMFRLSDNLLKPYDNPRTYYELTFGFFKSTQNEKTKIISYNPTRMETEPCNIDKHFGEYRNLFINITDINTYFCVKWTLTNQTLMGQYGDAETNTFNHWLLRGCVNDTEVICQDEKKIKETLSVTYLDFKTIDNYSNSIDENPKKTIIKSDRFPISNTIFKRLFMRYQNVIFNNDIGIIFKNIQKIKFFQFLGYKEEIDLRDTSNFKEFPNSFLWFTVHHTDTSITYYREYLKLQNLLANIGGIIKGINYIGVILTYFISEKFFYQDMINQNARIYDIISDHIYIQNNKIKEKLKVLNNNIETKEKTYIVNPPNSNRDLKNNRVDENKDEYLKSSEESIPSINNNKNLSVLQNFSVIKKKKIVKLSLLELICPFCCTSPNIKKIRYEVGFAEINEQLNVSNIANQLYQFKIFKKLILDEEQSTIFDFLFSNPLSTKRPDKEIVEASKDLISRDKITIIDYKLINQIKTRVSNLDS